MGYNSFMLKRLTLLVLLFLFLFSTGNAQTFVFLNNLRQGDNSIDVFELQKLLNSDPRTQIAVFGPGSPGNETTYFGTLTYRAVIKFQALYSQQILAPAGVLVPTGFVGPSTRAQLNLLATQYNAPTSASSAGLNVQSVSVQGASLPSIPGIGTLTSEVHPFGGKITNISECNCPQEEPLKTGFKRVKYDPFWKGSIKTIMSLFYDPLTTKLYAEGKVDEGVWHLGKYREKNDSCKYMTAADIAAVVAGGTPSCSGTYNVDGTIIYAGTSGGGSTLGSILPSL